MVAIPPGWSAHAGRCATSEYWHARDLCPLALERIGQILRDPMSPDTAVIRAAELVLERGYGKAPAMLKPANEYRDPLQMTDAEISERLAALRAELLKHGIDPLALPDRSGSSS